MGLRAVWGVSPGTAGGLLTLVLALSCGARTGLQQPCEQPLERIRPSVLLLLSHGAELGDETPYFRRFGRPLGVLFREELQEIAPEIAEATRFGVLVHPRLVPRNGNPSDACLPTPALQLGMGIHGPLELVESWFRYAFFIGPPPHQPNCCWGFSGPAVVGPNLPQAAAALRADARAHAETFIVLASHSHGDCGSGEVSDALPAVLQQITALRNEGIRTLVIGLDTGSSEHSLFYLDFLARMAFAGGLARTDERLPLTFRREDFPFVDAWDRRVVREEIRRRVLSSYWCRGMVGGDWDLSRSDLVAQRTDGRVIPRDTTHLNGWDHDGARLVTFYGAACNALQDDRQDLRFLLPAERCH